MANTTLKSVAGVQDNEKYHRIRFISEQFDRYETYWTPDIERVIRNARMYWHVNFGQWPQYVVDKLRNQGRRPPTFPIIPDKIETLVGSTIANGFDMKVEPMDGKISTLTTKMQDIIYSDKNRMNWEQSEITCLLDSYIMVGYERMKISDEINEFGNIAFETLSPRHVYLDPGWKTNYIRDLYNYFVFDMMTATQIKRAYSGVSDRLNEQYQRELREGIDYGNNTGGAPRYRTVEEKWMTGHKVIEFHYIKDIDRKYEYDKKNNCFFPDTGFKFNSEEDHQVKIEYAQMMGLTPDDIVFLRQKKRVKYIEACVPSLDKELFLTKGKDIIQTNNVNLYPLGIRFNGQYQGIVDRLFDIQTAANKGEMNIQDIEARMAKGAFLLDRGLTGGDPELEREIEQKWNDAGARIWVDEGSTERLAKGGIIPLPITPPSSSNFHQTERMYEMADRFSKVPAAQESRTEQSGESGRLFKFKVEMGIISQKFMLKFLEWHKKAKVEACIDQAKITYAGRPREFTSSDGKGTIQINTEVTNIFTGQKEIFDDISRLPKMRVIVIPSRSGINIRNDIRDQMSEVMQFLNEPEDRLLRVIVTGHVIMSGDLDDESKEEVKRAIEMLKFQAALATAANIKQAEFNLKQAEYQVNKLMTQLGEGQQPPDDQQKIPQQKTISNKRPPQQIESAVEGTTQETVLPQQKEA